MRTQVLGPENGLIARSPSPRKEAKSILATVLTALLYCHAAFCRCPADSFQVVATVGGDRILFQDYLDRYEDYLIFTGIHDNLQARYAILNNMVNELLLRHHDDNSKIYGNPEYNKELIWSKEETVLAFLKDREVYAKIKVSDGELRQAYKRSSVKLAVRHLYAPTEASANEMYSLLTIGVNFKELAKQVFTDSVLQNNGGYLGYITWGDTDPDFENAAYSLQVGETSKPVRTATGFSIIKLEERIENPFQTEDDFVRKRHKLERGVRILKKVPYERAYLKRVFDERKVSFNKKALSAVFAELKKTNFGSRGSDFLPAQESEKCVQYGSRAYSQRDIAAKLLNVPKYNLAKLTTESRLKSAVLGLVMKDVLLAIAASKGYDTTPEVVRMYANLANNIYLSYKRNEILEQVPVPDSEVVRYYETNAASFTRERELNVREIIVDGDSLAQNLRRRIERGENFGMLAQKHSLRAWSAKYKGEIGLSPVSNYGALKDTFWNAPQGKTLGPIKVGKYYGLFQVIGKKDGEPIDLALVRSRIVNAIKNEKGFPYMKKHLDELSKRTEAKINDDLVKNFHIDFAG